jgi:hypothetical protein
MTPQGTLTVFVIDDDAAVRASIQGLLKSVSLRSEAFRDDARVPAQQATGRAKLPHPGCETSRGQRSGLQRELADADVTLHPNPGITLVCFQSFSGI